MPPPITIRCLGLSFAISAPYMAGHSLNEAEAQALNALRAQRIKENLQGAVKKALDFAKAEGKELSGEALAELQHAFTSYDAGYALQARGTGRGALDRLGKEIEALARQRTEEHFRGLGLDPSDEEFEDMVLAMSTMPGLVSEAQKRVEAASQIVLGSIEDLMR